MPHEQDPTTLFLDELRRGDFGRLSPSLREPLTYLLSRGYRLKGVHLHGADPEIVLDRPINRDVMEALSLPTTLHCFDDHDPDDSYVGVGFICEVTNQSLTGQCRGG